MILCSPIRVLRIHACLLNDPMREEDVHVAIVTSCLLIYSWKAESGQERSAVQWTLSQWSQLLRSEQWVVTVCDQSTVTKLQHISWPVLSDWEATDTVTISWDTLDAHNEVWSMLKSSESGVDRVQHSTVIIPVNTCQHKWSSGMWRWRVVTTSYYHDPTSTRKSLQSKLHV